VSLRIGDRVRVVAPAGPLPGDLLTAGVARLAAWGLHVTLGDHARDRHPALAYLAGTDTDRAHDLQRAWCDPDVDAVFCARGGYGGLRLANHLDWDALAAATPKPLIGSSDTTALLHLFATRLAAPVVFGPMIATKGFATDPVAREYLRRCLFEPDRPIVVTGPDAGPLGDGPPFDGTAHGVTAGGNASLLAALTGAAPPPPDGAILLLEDITEHPYRMDRILTQRGRRHRPGRLDRLRPTRGRPRGPGRPARRPRCARRVGPDVRALPRAGQHPAGRASATGRGHRPTRDRPMPALPRLVTCAAR
jgi:muramoyltetrapeptide carboxypeptidase